MLFINLLLLLNLFVRVHFLAVNSVYNMELLMFLPDKLSFS